MEKEQYKKYGRKAEIRELLKESEEVALGDVCDIKQGTTIKKNNIIDGEYPYYGSNGIICNVDNYQLDGEYIITGRVGTLGKYILVNQKFNLCDNAFYIKPKTSILIKYLYYYSVFIYSYKFNNLQGLNSLNSQKYKEFKIPLPSSEVQQQCIELFEQKETYIQSIEDKIIQEKKYIEELKQFAKDVISNYC